MTQPTSAYRKFPGLLVIFVCWCSVSFCLLVFSFFVCWWCFLSAGGVFCRLVFLVCWCFLFGVLLFAGVFCLLFFVCRRFLFVCWHCFCCLLVLFFVCWLCFLSVVIFVCRWFSFLVFVGLQSQPETIPSRGATITEPSLAQSNSLDSSSALEMQSWRNLSPKYQASSAAPKREKCILKRLDKQNDKGIESQPKYRKSKPGAAILQLQYSIAAAHRTRARAA